MWRPRKVSQGSTDPTQENNPAKHQGGKSRKSGGKTKATIVTVEVMWGKEKERSWGPLSRATAWRVGIFCEDLNGDVKVFLDKNGERKEAEVEKKN